VDGNVYREANICSRTANRYIQLYELIAVYPRVVICDIAFETIMYCKDDIIKELASDPELGIRFKVPLRDIKIYVDMDIDGGNCHALRMMKLTSCSLSMTNTIGMLDGSSQTALWLKMTRFEYQQSHSSGSVPGYLQFPKCPHLRPTVTTDQYLSLPY